MSDETKAAEARGYARGYAASNRKHARQQDHECIRREEQAFLDRAFLAALPACIEAQGWSRTVDGEKQPIANLAARTELAWDFAREALKQRRGNSK